MEKRKFIAVVNICIVGSLAIFFMLGRLNGPQLLIVGFVSLVILNVAAVLGFQARRRP